MNEMTDEELIAELEAERKINISDDKLQQVSDIAERMRDLGALIARLEQTLVARREQYDHLQYGDLPEAMDGIGMEEFRLRDGTRLEVVPVLRVSYEKDKIDNVEEYLDKTGNSGLIKRTIGAIIPRGEPEERYRRVKDFIAQAGYEAQDKKEVNWQTLNKWAREWVEQGQTIPEDVFNVFQGRQARLLNKAK